MRTSLIANLIGSFLLCPLLINSALSQTIDNQVLSNQLEEILNNQKYDLLKELFLQTSFKKFENHYLDFRKNYKDAQWSIKTIRNNHDSAVLEVRITSKRKIGTQIYNLNSKQTVKIGTLKNKIKSYQIINEESILHSQNSPLVVKIISPNKVLTGEKYEINLIVKEPLDNSLLASGIIVLESKKNMSISDYRFGIKPNQSGGLFKYIKAPLEPGFQTFSAIITHPKGIYSITKKIKVDL